MKRKGYEELPSNLFKNKKRSHAAHSPKLCANKLVSRKANKLIESK